MKKKPANGFPLLPLRPELPGYCLVFLTAEVPHVITLCKRILPHLYTSFEGVASASPLPPGKLVNKPDLLGKMTGMYEQ